MEENNRLENKPTQAATPMVFSTETMKEKQPEETKKEDKKAKGGLFHHGGNKSDVGSKGQGEKVGPSHGSSVHTTAGKDERNKTGGWFGSKEPKESPQKPSFPSGPHASTEVAGSFYSSEDCSPSASLRHKDPERESPEKNVCVPVPETTPPSQGDLPPPEEKPANPPSLSEWDDTFDAFATSRLKPELKKENFFASVAAEAMAFIDDPDAASPTERLAEPPHEKGTKVFEKADSQISSEMPTTLRSWTNFSGLDVGANLVSTTQEATVIEDVLSPVSAGSMGRRRKSSTPTVWTAAFASGNPGEKESSTSLTAENSAREEGDSNEEEPSSAGTNGWMTIATETAPDLSESTQSMAEPEHVGQQSTFSPRPAFLSEGAFEAKSGSRAAACVLPRSTFNPELSSETLPGSNVAAVPPRVLTDVAARRFPMAPQPGTEPQGAGSEEEMFDIRTSVYRLQASMRLEASEGRVKLSSDIRERHVILSTQTGTRGKEEMAAGSAVPPPKPPRWFAAVGGGGDGEEEDACDLQPRQRGSEERWEGVEGLKADVELPRSRLSSEPSVPASPSLPTLGMDAPEAGSKFLVSDDVKSATAVSAANLDTRASELDKKDTSLGEDWSEMDETDTAEQFETCTSKFSLDALGQSGDKESWSQPGLSSLMGTADNAKLEMASERELFPEELSVSGLNPPSKLDLGQSEIFWTALEEQEAAGHSTGLGPAARPRSPHPVKPISAAVQEVSSEKKQQHRSSLTTALSNGLEKLKTVTTSSVQPVAPSSHTEKTDSKKLKDPAILDQSAKYYHLTHDELIQLLLQREKELSKKEEHIHELENYIDQLLVRIMEQSPTLLQIPLGESKTK
ncbi:PREDICTED: rab11 family-interacting protein 5 isoform X4 [Calidris pugnax]|uniref:rab11 family-interacting protein 5 isoform X4 n=1 Tax=Calidris pugnax TaxID=198806 RepID=UPI00071CDA58|nr:PREDICTED: rab11 family-interacting protein 5 isoform X4 [Calidris pugnax]